MLKVCIISCGMIANSAHIPAYRQFPEDYEITAVCDINEQAARDTAERNGIPHYYTDPETMLEAEKPDVVSVCGPNCYHKEHTLLALRHGAHVLCEKPVAVSFADAVEMYETARKNGKVLMACQTRRFEPDRIGAMRYIERHGLSDVYYGEIPQIRRRGIPFWGAFHMKDRSCGGALIDIGVHMLDTLVWMLETPEIVSVKAAAMTNHKYEIGSLTGSGALTGEVSNMRKFDPDEMDVEDFSCAMLTFAGGIRIFVKIAWAANMPECCEVRLIGKEKGIFLPEGKVYYGESGEDTIDMPNVAYKVPFPGHMYITDNLRKVVHGEAAPIIRPEETLCVSKIIDMFYRSAALGREVFADEIR